MSAKQLEGVMITRWLVGGKILEESRTVHRISNKGTEHILNIDFTDHDKTTPRTNHPSQELCHRLHEVGRGW